MNVNATKLVCILALALGVFHSAQGQMKFRGSDGWGVDTRYEQLFSSFDLRNYSGKVTEIDTVTPMPDMGVGIQLVLSTSEGDVNVHLGPAWYVLNQDISFPKKDEIEVKGCKVYLSGSEFVMPVEIRFEENVLRLRDDEGNPFWNIIREN